MLRLLKSGFTVLILKKDDLKSSPNSHVYWDTLCHQITKYNNLPNDISISQKGENVTYSQYIMPNRSFFSSFFQSTRLDRLNVFLQGRINFLHFLCWIHTVLSIMLIFPLAEVPALPVDLKKLRLFKTKQVKTTKPKGTEGVKNQNFERHTYIYI